MKIAFAIWSALSVMYLFIGIFSMRSKKAVNFFANVETAKNISDVAAYNKAVGKLWITFAIGFEVFALPFLSAEQNSPFVLLSVLGVVFLIIALVYSYMRILSKYQNKVK